MGYDFSNVKVHTDKEAVESAKAVNAKAYAVGNNVVFNEGQYNDESSEGKKLMAHELTHVLQQGASGKQYSVGALSKVTNGNVLVQRAGGKHKRQAFDTAQLEKFAKWPEEARLAWKKLDHWERNLVLWQMAANYGSDFAKKFLEDVDKRRPKDDSDQYFGKDVGPTPDQLLTRGFKIAQKDSVHEWWVNPSGKGITRNYTSDKPGDVKPSVKDKTDKPAEPSVAPSKEKRPSLPKCADIDRLNSSICDAAERICSIAEKLGEKESYEKCEKANVSCAQANTRSTDCNTI